MNPKKNIDSQYMHGCKLLHSSKSQVMHVKTKPNKQKVLSIIQNHRNQQKPAHQKSERNVHELLSDKLSPYIELNFKYT